MNRLEIVNQLNSVIFIILIGIVKNLILNKRNVSRKKRLWVRNWISRRQNFGASTRLLREMRQEDVGGFINHLRMAPEKFDEILCKIEGRIRKRDTSMRDAIPPKTKLEITLRFLASGDSYASLEALFRVGKSTISKFVPEVCAAISIVLKDFIKVSIILYTYILFACIASNTVRDQRSKIIQK